MQFEEAERLARKWRAMGNPHCDHPSSSKEYGGGIQGFDWRCDTCGAEVTKPEAGRFGPSE